MAKALIVQNPTPTTLIERAIEKGVDISQLKELMDLQERWERNEAHKQFLDALSNFQTKVPVIKKNRTAKIVPRNGGSSFSYKYSELGTIAQCIKKALNECGLSYRWGFKENNGKLVCTCYVSHRGGHTEATEMEAGKDNSGAKNDIQQTGSTQTYLQRYTLIGALGLSTAEDDNDGKTSSSGLTDEEILQQWKDAICQVKTKIELTNLYLKNKKVIDSDSKLQALMKERQDALNQTKSNHQTVSMP